MALPELQIWNERLEAWVDHETGQVKRTISEIQAQMGKVMNDHMEREMTNMIMGRAAIVTKCNSDDAQCNSVKEVIPHS